MQDKPLAQKLDEQFFEKFLKYNPQTQNLWDIVGFFEYERQKLRLEVAQYHEEIKLRVELRDLRSEFQLEENLAHIGENHSINNMDSKKPKGR